MPGNNPSVQKQILSLPFRKGLSQKEDPRWLEPGSMLTAQNTVHTKTNTLQKRTGYTALTTKFRPTNPGSPTGTIAVGRRLANDRTNLMLIGRDQLSESAYVYDDTSQSWILVDRVPETHVLPDRVVASYDDVIREMDCTICNGYAVYVWRVSANGAGAGVGQVYFKVESAATGDVIFAAQMVDRSISPAWLQVAPKVATNGTNVIIGFVTGTPLLFGSIPPSLSLHLYTLDCTQPWLGVGSPLIISSLVAPNAVATADFGAWDIVANPTSNTTVNIVYQQYGVLNVPSIFLANVTMSSTPVLASSFNLTAHDSVYVADAFPYIYAFGIDVIGNTATIAYSYPVVSSFTGKPLLRLNCQQALRGTGALVNAGVSSDPGNNGPSSVTVDELATSWPHTIQVTTQGTGTSLLDGSPIALVSFSPYNAGWYAIQPGGNVGINTAFIYTVKFIGQGGNVWSNTNPTWTWGVVQASRWLTGVNSLAYTLARVPSWEQGTYVMLSFDGFLFLTPNGSDASWFPMRQVATFAPRLSSMQYQSESTFFTQDQGLPHSVPGISLNSAIGSTVYQSLISVSSTVQSQNPTLVQVDMNSPQAYSSQVLGSNTGIACGVPSASDGVRVHEFAFPYYPSIYSTLVNYGVFLGLPPATYSYIAIYDWVDARGQLHRSARSGAQAATVNAAGSASVTVNVTTMGFSAKEKSLLANQFGGVQQSGYTGIPVTIRLFRTQANGTVYYECASAPNKQGVSVVTFTDSLPDSLLGVNDLLYGDGLNAEAPGAILDHHCPPAFQHMIVHRNRFFGIDGKNIWGSAEFTDGEGSGFNELSAFSWDDGPGPNTALASMDDKLIVFKANRVGYVTGQGPQDDGGQNDWSPVLTIASDLGCLDWRSVVVSASGVYFDSGAGRRLLTRDLQVVPVTDVEDVLTTNPVTTSAVVHPTQGRVLSTMNTDDASSPRVGVGVDRDYILDSWMTSVNIEGAISAIVADAPQAGVQKPTYTWVGIGGVCYRETPGLYLDAGAFVPMQVETAWIKAEGIEGFARFRRLQVTWQAMDPHALSLYVAYDYSPTYYLLGTVTWANMVAMPNYPMCAQLFSLPRQRAQSVRFKLVDAIDANTAAVTGQGPVLISMGLEISAYTNRRTNRLTAAQRT